MLDLYIKPANGVGEEKLLLKNANGVNDWSTDGKIVLYQTGTPFKIWALPMTGDEPEYAVTWMGSDKWHTAGARSEIRFRSCVN